MREKQVLDKNQFELRNILCSLFYLSREAEMLGMDMVSKVISSSITKIKIAIDNQNVSFDDLIIHDDTIDVMKFLYAYATANEQTRRDIIKALNHDS